MAQAPASALQQFAAGENAAAAPWSNARKESWPPRPASKRVDHVQHRRRQSRAIAASTRSQAGKRRRRRRRQGAHRSAGTRASARRSRHRRQPRQCRRRAGGAVELARLRPISAVGEVWGRGRGAWRAASGSTPDCVLAAIMPNYWLVGGSTQFVHQVASTNTAARCDFGRNE